MEIIMLRAQESSPTVSFFCRNKWCPKEIRTPVTAVKGRKQGILLVFTVSVTAEQLF
jgi:hypothetical protein